MSPAAFGVRKPVVVNLVTAALIIAGVVFGIGLRKEFFPEVRPTQVSIAAPYPGASPEEIEDALAIKIEDRIAELEDVEEINTTITEGLLSIMVEFQEGVAIEDAVFDVKNEIDALQDLPEESERITVAKFEPNLPAINVSVFGDLPERVLKDTVRRIRDDLSSLEGMGEIRETGLRTDEISVEVDPDLLVEHSIPITEVTDRINAAMIEIPGGAVRSPTANVAVKTVGADDAAAEVRDIVVRARGDGQVLRVRDIATVREGFEDVDVVSRLNAKPAGSLTIYKVGDDDAVEISAMVKAYVAGRNGEELELTLGERLRTLVGRPGDDGPVSPRVAAYRLGAERGPTPGSLITTTDLARFIVGRLELLSRNAAMGGVLVLGVLMLLLNWRVAMWVALGLIVSLLGTLAVMRFTGITLNLLTMFGLIIVIGLLVDDAIVVAENITARHERGEPALDAAVAGTRQVNWPVVATVLTTICAFMPLGLIEGRVGDLMGVLPLVVIVALGVSLVECLFILPSHMGHSLINADRKKRSADRSAFGRLEDRLDEAREGFFKRLVIPGYTRLLRGCLRRPYLTFTGAVALVIVSIGMVAGERVPFTFIATEDAETVNISLRMPVGTPVEATEPVVRALEEASLAQEEVSAVFASIGSTASLDGESSSRSPHLAQLILELKPVEQRDRSSSEVIVAIRGALDPRDLVGVESLRMEEVSGGPEGPPITLAAAGEDPEDLAAVARAIADELAEFEGVYDIADDNDLGRRELRIRLRDAAQELGFTPAVIARQVRGAVFGLEAHTFAGEREDVDVRVLFPDEDRRSLAAVERMYVFSPAGVPVPLDEVARVELATGYATLSRLDRRRVVTVTAEVNQSVANPEKVMTDLRPALDEINAAYPTVEILERGRQKDVQESFATLPVGMLSACLLIYVILAWLFSSYVQPLIVLLAVPFALIGMIWGHFALGYDMTILSLIGFIALAGVVVNDSLIFMEFYNERRAESMSVFDAAVEAGRARVRAIILTTVTTVLGLLPLMLEQSFQARFLIPMAITISFGLASATVIILVVLPCCLVIFSDLRRGWLGLWSGAEAASRADDPNSPLAA